ncbi:MAG TPA: alpha/beta fold hydrolase [Candidatus Methylomirabilis sp.]|nr:alpha/beta fold hydrolase [Candidatus Methylomirabilis sp.]
MTAMRSGRVLTMVSAFGLLASAAVAIGVSVVSGYVFSPPRRELQSYHRDRLAHPAEYGLRIASFECIQAKVPCLLVEPDADAVPGARGSTLRRQLAEMGVAAPPYGAVGGIVVLLHARAGRKEDLLPVAERFVAAGFRCLIPDLPGHGESPLPKAAFGADEFEGTLPRRALANTRKVFALPPEPAALWGISMGGAFAIRAASESPEMWRALVVVSGFDALDEVIAADSSNYVGPIGRVLGRAVDAVSLIKGEPRLSEIRPEVWAGRVKAPTLVVHGDCDQLIPIERGRKLYEALASDEKRWIQVAAAGHHNVLTTPAPLYAEMSAWLLRWMRAPTNDEEPDRTPRASAPHQ